VLVRFHREAVSIFRSLASKSRKTRKLCGWKEARLRWFSVFSSGGSFPFPKPSLRDPKKNKMTESRHLTSKPGRKSLQPRHQTLTPSLQTARPNHDSSARAGSEQCLLDRTRLQGFCPHSSKPSRGHRERQFSNCEAQSKSSIFRKKNISKKVFFCDLRSGYEGTGVKL